MDNLIIFGASKNNMGRRCRYEDLSPMWKYFNIFVGYIYKMVCVMIKKIFIGIGSVAIGIGALISMHLCKNENCLLFKNIEALSENESGGVWKTCYYINVYASDSPYLLSCSTCTYKYGFGRPVAQCRE